MRYVEHPAPRWWWAWLAVLFVVLLVPHCWLPELTHNEARYAVIAQEMASHYNFLSPTLFGQKVFVFPLCSWILALASFLVPLSELTIRLLLGLVPTALLALTCGWISYRLAGAHAGAVSAAAVMSIGVVAFQRGALGEENMIFALLINGAWLLWYRLGRVRKRWFLAWLLAHLLVCLAILAGGMKAVFFFYFPLLWLRRPLKIRRRIAQADHWLSLLLMVAAIAAWILLVPEMKEYFLAFFRNFEAKAATRGYVSRLIRFPLRTVLGILPWAFLAWPTYCEAFRPLERQPIFSSFLRTVVSSLFFVFWFLPLGSPAMLMPLLGPMAILIGMNYDLLVRRYGPELLLIVRVAGWFTLFCGVLVAVMVVVFMGSPIFTELPQSVYITAIVLVVLSCVMALVCMRWRLRLPVWLMVLLGVLMVRMMFGGSFLVFRYATKNEKRQLAAQLSSVLPETDDEVYVLFESNKGLFPAEWFYLKRRVVRLESAEQQAPDEEPKQYLPDKQVVYVLGERLEPIAKNREWIPLTDPIEWHDDNVFRLWKGVLTERVERWQASALDFDRRTARVSSWVSSRPATLELKPRSAATRPLWVERGFRGRPALRFTGSQALFREDSDRVRVIGTEQTVVMLVRASAAAARQTLIDITRSDGQGSILLRLVYLAPDKALSVFYRDQEGKYRQARADADLTKPSIIVVRRNKRVINITVATAEKSADIPEEHALGDFEDTTYVTTVGATWDGERFTDYLTGDVVELHIYNQALSDDRMFQVINSLRDTYLELQ